VFEAASLSKPVVAYAALKLVDAGRLDLDKPLSEYLDYADLHRNPRGRLITARMVLSHTSGLQNERIGNDTLTFALVPGTHFQYSGEGYTYLGKVIEKITGLPLDFVIERLVFRPLGMKHSSFIWKPAFETDAVTGYGRFGEVRQPTRPLVARAPSSLHTTAADYAIFLAAIIRRTGLKARTWRAMTSPAIAVAPGIHWSLGWGVEAGDSGVALWHHGDNSNSGFTSFALIDLRRQCGVVYFANSVTGLSIAREVSAFVTGSHPSVAWIHYERYNSPAVVARRMIGRALSVSTDSALILYRSLKQRDSTSVPENLLNGVGYLLLNRGQVADAIRIFQENVRAYPESGNVYDSLGDAFIAAKNGPAALDAYTRAARIDPTNAHARGLIDSLSAANRK
jgi:CubicO group peptidase (beta-lactamase class C family)